MCENNKYAKICKIGRHSTAVTVCYYIGPTPPFGSTIIFHLYCGKKYKVAFLKRYNNNNNNSIII